jgi:hypothetical protein
LHFFVASVDSQCAATHFRSKMDEAPEVPEVPSVPNESQVPNEAGVPNESNESHESEVLQESEVPEVPGEPGILITIVRNWNPGHKALLRLHPSISFDPRVRPSVMWLVTERARMSVRIKRPKRFFDDTGYELRTVDDWKERVVDGAVLFVSEGEEWIHRGSDEEGDEDPASARHDSGAVPEPAGKLHGTSFSGLLRSAEDNL